MGLSIIGMFAGVVIGVMVCVFSNEQLMWEESIKWV